MKNIILLSDGTGNSSAKLFKTNVWRMYQSLDLDDGAAQVAYYNDGVGTSSFKPLAVLGGAFGWGLKRNVLALYRFLCEAYEPGDKIYLFGFSRGAFTVRMLAGMIARMGVLTGCDEATLGYAVADTYRRYRNKAPFHPPFYDYVFKPVRDRIIRLIRKALGQTLAHRRLFPRIAFVGVWDTVAAYGTPFAELTRGVDLWVYPLSFSDRRLSPKVEGARHALALDDERDTFHPVLWDEAAETSDRIKQVWFAGMHADIGGGYPDDALSRHPFDWMKAEAEAAGLRFLQRAEERFTPPHSCAAPLHDSRQGLGSYYRYQPRKIAPHTAAGDAESLIMQDPHPNADAMVRRVIVHHTVPARMRPNACRYAPIVLPAEFHVLEADGSVTPFAEDPTARQARISGQRLVWDWVWHKRVNYFLIVFVSLLLGLFPLLNAFSPSTACEGVACLASPVIRGVGAFTPAVVDPWFAAFAGRPGLFLLLAALLAGLGLRGGSLQRQVRDQMWQVWAPFRTGSPAGGRPDEGWVYRLRTNGAYQAFWRTAKWRVVPAAFGIFLVLLIAAETAYLAAAIAMRIQVASAERSGTVCERDGTAENTVFATSRFCWSLPDPLEAKADYRIDVAVTEPWMDDTIPANPQGFGPERLPFPIGWVFLPLRRSMEGRWFQPFITIQPDKGGARRAYPLEFHPAGNVYTAKFTPDLSGKAFLWVNDAVATPVGLSKDWYHNNRGAAAVKVQKLPDLDCEAWWIRTLRFLRLRDRGSCAR